MAEPPPLRLRDETTTAKVLVRARRPAAVVAVLGVTSGGAVRDAEGTLVVGSGPGEWLLLATPGTAATLCAAVTDRLRDAASEDLVTVVDYTSARALLRVAGTHAGAALAMLCAVDLEAMPSGSALRTSVAGVVAEVVREGDAHLLCFDSSYARYVTGALLDAGAEFGMEVDGAQPPR